MQFRRLIAKAKQSSFLIVLFLIGIGVLVILNFGNEKDSSPKKSKPSSESTETVFEKFNEQNKPIESNAQKESNGIVAVDESSLSIGGSESRAVLVNAQIPNPTSGLSSVSNKSTLKYITEYENNKLGMKVVFPENWGVADRLFQNTLFHDRVDQDNPCLFIVFPPISEEADAITFFGARALKTNMNAKQYVEEIEKNPSYYMVNGDNQLFGEEYKSSDMMKVKYIDSALGLTEYYTIDTFHLYGDSCRTFCIFERKGYLIIFVTSYSKDYKGKAYADMKTILANTTWF